MKKVDRRDFLRTTAAAGISAGLAGTMGSFAAHAADTGGYRAIVCLFLKGGLDCHDTLLPYDTQSYAAYERARRSLIPRYARGAERTRNNLLELSPRNRRAFGSRAFALPPNMEGLHRLFEAEKASIISNVGPLVQPLNRNQFRDGSRALPGRLFSHNDQQSTWMSLETEGASVGWGGRFADAAVRSNANRENTFTAISVTGTDVWLSGENTIQYHVGRNGASQVAELERLQYLRTASRSNEALTALRNHYRSEGVEPRNWLEKDVADINRRAIDVNGIYIDAVDRSRRISTRFPDTHVGGQLSRIASTINARGRLGASRQVFYAEGLGFDTHDNQVDELPSLQTEFSDAIFAFQQAMEEMGVSDDVTLITMGDFGRTLVTNGDGTDHGWGGHHFVVGGAVNGGQILGETPPVYELGHDLDAGNGRLIPTTSIEQYASPIGRWFGLSDRELNRVLPRARQFPNVPLIV